MQRQSITLINHRALNDCRLMVSGSISLSSLEFFSPFPTVLVHYRSVSSIWDWRVVPQFQSKYHVFRPTQDTIRAIENLNYRSFTFYLYTFQVFHLSSLVSLWSYNPQCKHRVCPNPNFARRYSQESGLISLPLATEMFHFTRFAPRIG